MLAAVLLLHHRPLHAGLGQVDEHVAALARHSRYKVLPVNTELGMPPMLRATDFVSVMLHWSLFGGQRYQLGDVWLDWLTRSDSYRIAFFQDEYRYCRQRFAFINEFRVDAIATLLEEPWAAQVYGSRAGLDTHLSMLPGYVSESLRAESRRAAASGKEMLWSQRPVDVSYRARRLPPYMGRAAMEKAGIGAAFGEAVRDREIVLDIDTSERARLAGDAWKRLLGGSRAVLGTESGASIFDLDDEVRTTWERLGGPSSYEAMPPELMMRWEGKVPYLVVGPRHFEAAALGALQVMFPGRYSGLMRAWEHYVPLERDLSNLDAVLAVLADPAEAGRIVAAARRDLIESGEHDYERLVSRVDELVASGVDIPFEGGRGEGAVVEAVRAWTRTAQRRAIARRAVGYLRHAHYPGRGLARRAYRVLASREPAP